MPYINDSVKLSLNLQANEGEGNTTGPLPNAASVYAIPNTIRIDLPGQESIVFENQETIILGRGTEASLSLPDFDPLVGEDVPLVSRRHALIHRTEWGITVQDLGSTNGTWLNGDPLTPGETYMLRSGDQLKLAEQLLFVYFSSSDDLDRTALTQDPPVTP
jgi:pSer/pThr/pTyr-binding forkhead associated (FHA) protein